MTRALLYRSRHKWRFSAALVAAAVIHLAAISFANIRKAEAQVEKDKADLSTAKRNLDRNIDLFHQKFIAQAALDTAQNSVDTLTAQLGVDRHLWSTWISRRTSRRTRAHAVMSKLGRCTLDRSARLRCSPTMPWAMPSMIRSRSAFSIKSSGT